MRATVSDMGPLLLARMLALNETQQGVLQLVFKIADDNGLLLLDLKDLRAMLQYVGDNAAQFHDRVRQRQRGQHRRDPARPAADRASRAATASSASRCSTSPTSCRPRIGGKQQGVINILAADQLLNSPRLYATFLLWMLSELFETLPEVGDLDKPKLVFFFDEAHLLFNDAPKALVERIELVVRLVRSKGVGVYFVTQNPLDIPDTVLAQLGNRVQHALRAFTPRDQKAVKAAASTMRANPKLDVETAITELGVGEALVSLLDAKGRPSVTERVFVIPPAQPDRPDHAERAQGADRRLAGRRRLREDGRPRVGVREAEGPRRGQRRRGDGAAAGGGRRRDDPGSAAPAPADADGGMLGGLKDVLFGSTGPRGGKHEGLAESAARSAVRSIGSSVGREIIRGVLGSILGGGCASASAEPRRRLRSRRTTRSLRPPSSRPCRRGWRRSSPPARSRCTYLACL